ncbi:2-oxo acid dehydrogenase subunit E2 [Brevibacillus fluminis]|uniref:Dihydrolipoamide acetyltransferase component of pyruvate dehydrogenase complex n=1 Tax=Brevibacillus fluminis TaxID=511487 RepID=A0A3M8DI37_9BACL|nr:dihydrolipoamide acetyltransferase family protein [Brevibacillus fluminis]RNB87131.1 2-oxo acid dehydrogenase subunit E2 [Brevibacillus fluminis]
MANQVIMPKLGMAMVEGTVIAWKKKAGDTVKKGEGIVDISSEKIEMEVESPGDGVLLRILVPEGSVVPYGTVLGSVGGPGELAEEALAVESSPAAVAAQGESAAAILAAEPAVDAPREPAFAQAGRDGIKISPVARKMADEAGLDVSQITGTGPQGRITKEDVELMLRERGGLPAGKAAEAATGQADTVAVRAVSAASTGGPASTPDASLQADAQSIERIPVTGMRKVIAERMQASLQQSAQLTMTMHADVTALLKLRESLSQESQRRYQVKLSVTDLIARATVLALMEHKQMNSAFLGSHIEQYGAVHLGMAVALEKGLVVPVIRHAEQKTLVQLAQAIKAASERARLNQLAPEEMKGSTFTISNLGNFGVESFTPVLNPPEAGILGVGAAKAVPAFVGEELVRQQLLPLSLTFDHRVLDGAPAAAFLACIKRHLEEAYSLLL